MTPSTVAGWRFVERDLHRIASQVTEYDSDARLIRNDETGRLGLARWVPSNLLCNGGYWALVREIFDLDTDRPLTGEPDGRVMRFMRAADSRGRNMAEWHRRSKVANWMREKRQFDEYHDQNMDTAERFMKALEKDVTTRPKQFIPADVPKAA